MDTRQHIGDALENSIVQFNDKQAQIFTTLPGIIQSYDAETNTCTVQPAVMGVIFGKDGNGVNTPYPLLSDVPVEFPGGGGCHLTFPVKNGDECKISFHSRSFDAWHQQGGVQPQQLMLMHDLSNATVQVGLMSQPNLISNISTSRMELRSDDGLALIAIDPQSHDITIDTDGSVDATIGGNVNATVQGSLLASISGGVYLDAPNSQINGNVVIMGDLTVIGNTSFVGTVKMNGKRVDDTHTHTTTTSGSPTSAVN